MGNTYTRQSATAIATGNVITAADLEAEFDEVVAAFNSSTGHAHDGTDSPRISTIGPAGEYTSTATEFKPTSTGLDLGSSASQWDDAYIDGTAYIDTGKFGTSEYTTITDNQYDVSTGNLTLDVAGDIVLDADGGNVTLQDAGVTFANLNNATGELVIQSGATPTTAVTFSGANADFAGTVDVTGAVTLDSTLDVTGNVDITGTLGVDGNVTLGASSNLAISSQLIMMSGSEINMAGSTVLYDLRPSANNSYDLGSSSLKWKDIYIDGTAYIDNISGIVSLDVNTADISILKTGILQASDGSATATIADTTGNITFTSDVIANSVDINGGSIDNTTIGFNTDAYGKFSNLVSSLVDINGGNIDGTSIGNTTPRSGTFTTLTANTLLSTSNASIGGGTINGTSIGATTASTGDFTYLNAANNAVIDVDLGVGNNLTVGGTASITGALDAASIDNTPIGATTKSTGAFTSLSTSISYSGPQYILTNTAGDTTYGRLSADGNNTELESTASDIYLKGDQDVILQHGTGITNGIIIGEDGTTGNYATMQFSPSRNSLSIGVNSTGSADNDYYFQIEKDGGADGVYARSLYQKTRQDTATVADLGVLVIRAAHSSVHDITLETNATLYFYSSDLNDGTNTGIFNDTMQRVIIKVTQDSVGSHTLTWNTPSVTILWEGGTVPTQTATANKTDIYELINFGGGTTYYGRRIGANF